MIFYKCLGRGGDDLGGDYGEVQILLDEERDVQDAARRPA